MTDKENIIEPDNVTGRIRLRIFELLEKNPDGMRWSELLRLVNESDPSFHPKTVNGIIWKLAKRYPEKVFKPSKGVFRLSKYGYRESKNPS